MVSFLASSTFLLLFIPMAMSSGFSEQTTLKSISACQTIAKQLSKSSGVYYPGHRLYRKGNKHWASSSSQASACVVEPASAKDVSAILKIVGSTSTPFGIRSGGHTTNPGFSSTSGVQISLLKLSQLDYHPAARAPDGSIGTVDIGAGHVWDTVHKALEKHNATVVGSRATGVGVGGFILGGGGYGWLSNQYGLTVDTVAAFEVVLPNGTITTATGSKNPDLFFGLKGGFNNFGIVTKFAIRAFPQQKVWGGIQIFGPSKIPRIAAATADFFAKVKDPKAAIIVSFGFFLGFPGVSVLMFYDSPSPPTGIFERFTNVPNLVSDVKTRSMRSMLRSAPANWTSGNRGAFDTVSLKRVSPAMLEQVHNQTIHWGRQGICQRAFLISYDVESFLPSMTARNQGGAYPHDTFVMPLLMYMAWRGPKNDRFFIDALKESSKMIQKQAIAEGQYLGGPVPVKYGNYGTATDTLEAIFGTNLPRLRQIKQRYDPKNIMSLTGGYRL